MRKYPNLHLLQGQSQVRPSQGPSEPDEWHKKLDQLTTQHALKLSKASQGLTMAEQQKMLEDLRSVMRAPGFTRMPSQHRIKIQSHRLALEAKLPKATA